MGRQLERKVAELERAKQDAAAVKLQSGFRGKKGRDEVAAMRKEKVRLKDEQEADQLMMRLQQEQKRKKEEAERLLQELEEKKRNEAALKIQSAQRAKLARREVGALR